MSFSAVLATIAANNGGGVLKKRQTRSCSIDTGVTCQITQLKNETIKRLAKKDIEEKLLQGDWIVLTLINLQLLFSFNYLEKNLIFPSI